VDSHQLRRMRAHKLANDAENFAQWNAQRDRCVVVTGLTPNLRRATRSTTRVRIYDSLDGGP